MVTNNHQKFINIKEFYLSVDLIKLKGVTKEYRGHAVLQDVNLKIESGDLFGIVGQSGSGKTTLLNLVAGFLSPSKGEVVYVSKVTQKERNLKKDLHKIKKYIGFTPQHNSFYHKLTVLENLKHFGKLYNVKPSTLKDNIKNLLIFTHLVDYRHMLAEELSGGMQKRLDLSCSLVHRPKILILDEPTADVDPILQKEILFLLKEVNKQGITIIIASHHLEGIESICNKIAIIHQGKVHSQGLIDDVKKPFLKDHFTINMPSNKDKSMLIEKLKKLSIKKILDNDDNLVIYPDNVESAIGNLLNIIKEENLLLHDMDIRKPSLREIFENIAKK
jgi:ABC-2 type transport system ATP-binding protein